MKKDINYKSKDGITTIHAISFIPEKEVKVILQIEHGMNEYIGRYENVAQTLNNAGILVCGDDHLGHGYSIVDKSKYGYFAEKNATDIIVDDAYELTKMMKEEYPNIPYFILGHSMGSFITRYYITKYGDKVDGAIIMGSAYHSKAMMTFALGLTKTISWFKDGDTYRSKYLFNMTNGKYHKYFQDNKNPLCWLTRDKQVIDKYAKDPLVLFRFTNNAYYTMFNWIKLGSTKKVIKNIPTNLPIFFMGGKDDPVGNMGADMPKLKKLYTSCGLTNVKYKIYKDMRHELFNELENAVIYDDIIRFINETIQKKTSN